MTCILSRTSMFSTPHVCFGEEIAETVDEVGRCWHGARTNRASGPPERRNTPCRVEITTVTGPRYDMASSSKVHIRDRNSVEELHKINKPLVEDMSAATEYSIHGVTKCK